jgi:hypothetical protein
MSIRNTFVASLIGIFGYASAACANSCGNVVTFGSYDESGLRESEFGISAVGTFRIEGEEDESKQPLFNLTKIDCEKYPEDLNADIECKVTQAVMYAHSEPPDQNDPNCELDLDTSTYTMKQLQKGILTGIETGTALCINMMLTIDRNTKRIYLSFTKTEGADKYDKIRPGTCGSLPRTEVLMNCTGLPRMRKQGRTSPRYCDFSSSSDK